MLFDSSYLIEGHAMASTWVDVLDGCMVCGCCDPFVGKCVACTVDSCIYRAHVFSLLLLAPRHAQCMQHG
jgi:hypothetical protein